MGAAVTLPTPAVDEGAPLAVRPARLGVTLAQRVAVSDSEPVDDNERTPDEEAETESDGERVGSGDDEDEPVATLWDPRADVDSDGTGDGDCELDTLPDTEELVSAESEVEGQSDAARGLDEPPCADSVGVRDEDSVTVGEPQTVATGLPLSVVDRGPVTVEVFEGGALRLFELLSDALAECKREAVGRELTLKERPLEAQAVPLRDTRSDADAESHAVLQTEVLGVTAEVREPLPLPLDEGQGASEAVAFLTLRDGVAQGLAELEPEGQCVMLKLTDTLPHALGVPESDLLAPALLVGQGVAELTVLAVSQGVAEVEPPANEDVTVCDVLWDVLAVCVGLGDREGDADTLLHALTESERDTETHALTDKVAHELLDCVALGVEQPLDDTDGDFEGLRDLLPDAVADTDTVLRREEQPVEDSEGESVADALRRGVTELQVLKDPLRLLDALSVAAVEAVGGSTLAVALPV